MNTTPDRCYRNISIPAEFKPWDFGYSNKNEFCEIPIDPGMINLEIHDFFRSIGFFLTIGRYFHCPAGMNYNLHIDSFEKKIDFYDDLVKINWVFGGAESEMVWYNLKPGKNYRIYNNYKNEPMAGFDEKDCVEICRTHIPKLAIVNVSVVHTLLNPKEPRDCYSMFLASIHTNERVAWNELVEKMSPYITN